MNGYKQKEGVGTGKQAEGQGAEWNAASARTSSAAASVPAQAVAGEMAPVTSGRLAVRGLRASIQRSARRLAPMPSVRAAAMAMVIHTKVRTSGRPPAASTMPM